MSQVITAIYEHGVLHPVTPLSLQEHQRVKVQIVPDSSEEEMVNDVLQWLTSIGRITLPQPQKRKAPVAETKRAQLSRIIGEAAQKPLSKIILEDRDEQ